MKIENFFSELKRRNVYCVMSAETEQRKLAAIMFTDMVGYCALSQRDDKLALELLDEVRVRSLVRLGDKQAAIASLEKLMSAPSDPIFGPPRTPALLRLDPDFDSLRGDPRFEKLC